MATIEDFEAAKADVARLEHELHEAKARVRVMSTDADLAQELSNRAFRGPDSEARSSD